MHVNELAKRARVADHVIRYYTQVGLLQPSRDPNNRYRDYSESDVYRVRFIRRSKSLGFTLRDVKAILNDADRGVSPCREVRELIKLRASENHAHLDRLQRMQRRVEAAIAKWETMPDRLPDHESLCHLIDSVGGTEVNLT
jgi:DNA-binding transcriptional MerR regulator